MTIKDLIDLAGERDLAKSYLKADGIYIWDYKLVDGDKLELIVSNSGKAGFKDKVSVDEIVNYILEETNPEVPADEIISQIKIVGVEGITVAKI
jgi:hypothetical protein